MKLHINIKNSCENIAIERYLKHLIPGKCLILPAGTG
jgi:hypothetical protein